jgi:hypothetical protein
MRRLATAFAGAILTLSSASGYSHFIHYLSRAAPYQPVPEKFNLNSLPNRTVTFLVADSGPAQFAPGDSFASVLAQIRQAAQVWDSAPGSELGVAFGGLFSPGVPQNTPGGEIVFEELPPGVLAAGGPTSRAELEAGPNGRFVPITRATVRLNADLTRRPAPSYTEAFFETIVHEMGHALGLQHTFTSSAMSVGVTRSTYRLRPLESDDIAGIALLYPSANFLASTGTIAGRISAGGQGIHLASVVAIRPNGSAVSALTNPDGTYQIQGLPPDQYTIYVHPLPPTADIVLPLDADSRRVEPSGPVETLFFPGTRDPAQAAPVAVAAGGRIENVDFSVERRPAVSIYDLTAYSFAGSQAVNPAFLNSGSARGTLALRGPGIVVDNGAAPGLSVQVLGGAAVPANWIRAYGNPVSVAIDVPITLGLTGPRHLVFTTPSDVYVLPSAFHLVQKQPPEVHAVGPNTEGTASVLGRNVGAETKFFLDGIPAPVRGVSVAEPLTTVTVALPPGAGNRAVVTAFNPDGQNSTFGQTTAQVLAVAGADAPAVRVEPASLPAGTDAMVEVTALNTRFSDAAVLGFGSTDLSVRRLWVISPTRLLASVSLSQNATPGASLLSVINGFQVITQPFGFEVKEPNPRAPRLSAQLANTDPSRPGIYPGATVTMTGANLTTSSNGSTTTITLNDVRANIVLTGPSQIIFQIPAGLGPGPAVLRLFNGQENAPPAVVAIEAPPPVITSMMPAGGRLGDGVRPGDVLSMMIEDAPGAGQLDASHVTVFAGTQEVAPAAVVTSPGKAGTYQVIWILPQGLGAGPVAVRVAIDGRVSDPAMAAVRPL